jgi:hypothetical protein
MTGSILFTHHGSSSGIRPLIEGLAVDRLTATSSHDSVVR